MDVIHFLNGAIMLAEIGIGVFFLRFWRDSNDRLFVYFAFAFMTLALSQILVLLFGDNGEFAFCGYFVRLLAFTSIIIGIIEKNLPKKRY